MGENRAQGGPSPRPGCARIVKRPPTTAGSNRNEVSPDKHPQKTNQDSVEDLLLDPKSAIGPTSAGCKSVSQAGLDPSEYKRWVESVAPAKEENFVRHLDKALGVMARLFSEPDKEGGEHDEYFQTVMLLSGIRSDSGEIAPNALAVINMIKEMTGKGEKGDDEEAKGEGSQGDDLSDGKAEVIDTDERRISLDSTKKNKRESVEIKRSEMSNRQSQQGA